MKNFAELKEKIEKYQNEGLVDLSMEEDLSIAVMNMISLEEHFFYTAQKTNKDVYLEYLQQVRGIRTTLMKRLLSKTEGEVWCISKHLLATTMRLTEVGTKLYSKGEKKQASQIFDYAFEVYSMFWAIRLDIVDYGELKSLDEKDQDQIKEGWSIKDIVKKLVDCCKEW